MKKIIAVLLAVVLTLGMASVAFAADSPVGDDDEIIVEATTAISEADVIAAAKSLGVNTDEYSVYFIFDIHLKSGKPYEGTYTHAFDIGSVTDAVVIHQHNGTWRKLPVSISGGKANATFEGFSYGAVLVKKAPASQDQKQDQKNDQKSPATGEVPFVAGMALIAVLAVAGIVVSRRKSAE